MAVRRSLARLVSSRVGVFAWLALCWCWRRWRGGAWPLPGWRCWRSASCLAHGWAGAFAWLAGVGAGAVYRLAALACAGPVCSAAGQLPGRRARPRLHGWPQLRRGPAHRSAAPRLRHRRTARRKRPRPAAEGIYRARSRLLVSYANMPPIVPQPVQSAQKTATDFCAKIIPRPPKGGPWEGISAY